MQGGMKREWAVPYNPNPGPGQPTGSHRGHMSALNIRNPEPGYHYAYAHRGDMYRGFTQEMLTQGYEPVRRGEGYNTQTGADLPPEFGSPQDALIGVGNLVLMKIPIDKYRELQEDEAKYRANAINGPTDRFLGKAEEMRQQMGPGAARMDPCYALPEHGRNGYDTDPRGD